MKWIIYILAVVIPLTLVFTLKTDRHAVETQSIPKSDSIIVVADSVVDQVVRMHKEEAKTISRLNRKVMVKDITIDNQVQELERLLSESDSIKDVAIKNQRLADAAKMEAVVAKLEAIESERAVKIKLDQVESQNAWLRTKITKLEIENKELKKENEIVKREYESMRYEIKSNKRIQRMLK